MKPIWEEKKETNVSKKRNAGRGVAGKTPVVGVKDRETNQVKAQMVTRTDASTLQGFIHQNTEENAIVYTDEARAYKGVNRPHESVNHSVGEYVREMAHTQGMDSFWATLKRGYDGVYHHFSDKHLDRYIIEFEGRHNSRPLDTIDQMEVLAQGMEGKRLRYRDLTKK